MGGIDGIMIGALGIMDFEMKSNITSKQASFAKPTVIDRVRGRANLTLGPWNGKANVGNCGNKTTLYSISKIHSFKPTNKIDQRWIVPEGYSLLLVKSEETYAG
jgi:hypothetical protein